MLNFGEITNIVSPAPLTGSEGGLTSGMLFPAVSFYRGTSLSTYWLAGTLDAPVRDMLPYGLLARMTGAELRECSKLLQILPNNQSEAPTEIYSLPIQVRRLREISGLTIEHLAHIFGVSRITYHKWIDGSPLNDRHKEHLLEVLPLIEEALQRLGSTNAVSSWLLTPVSPGGKKPVEYLSTRQYTTFRGFLLHQRNSEELFRPLSPLKYAYRERPREEIEDELERLNPGVRLEEDDTSDIDEDE